MLAELHTATVGFELALATMAAIQVCAWCAVSAVVVGVASAVRP